MAALPPGSLSLDALFENPGSLAELTAAAAAILALILSLAAFSIAKRSERRQLFIHLHELLTDPESQAGRRLLYEVETNEDLDRLRGGRGDDIDLVNRAVGLFNTLGMYARHRYLPRRMAKRQWASTMKRAWPKIELYLNWRRKGHNAEDLWTDLIWFAELCGVSPERPGTKNLTPPEPTPSPIPTEPLEDPEARGMEGVTTGSPARAPGPASRPVPEHDGAERRPR